MLNSRKISRILIAALVLTAALAVGCTADSTSENAYNFNGAENNTPQFLEKASLYEAPAVQLAALRTPYVGGSTAVGKIVDALPQLGAKLTQRFFSIGDDYGTGCAPYTLTLYYEQGASVGSEEGGEQVNTKAAEQSTPEASTIANPDNAALLFALIDNLEEVSFALRYTPSGDELDKAAYTARITYSKAQIAEFLRDKGLDWLADI
ncbi:MAG: DUF4825 domain-containing protein [Clostridiales Family XIII bacterium]|jgi:hypothetical protein|nr:DUF4825 domain-containing protein [Clostridiales Family XIII bacterium]